MDKKGSLCLAIMSISKRQVPGHHNVVKWNLICRQLFRRAADISKFKFNNKQHFNSADRVPQFQDALHASSPEATVVRGFL
jgi:hypothetical protein